MDATQDTQAGEGAGSGRFRKKPVTIDAFRMGIDPRPDWFQDKVTRNEIITGVAPGEYEPASPFEFSRTCCRIKTLEGEMMGNYGDWIIRGVKGEVYPCKPDIFEATYEPAALPKASSPEGSPSPSPSLLDLEAMEKMVETELNCYWPAACNACGWIGSSEDAHGGRAIADTGDFSDVTCPKCEQVLGDYDLIQTGIPALIAEIRRLRGDKGEG